MTLTQNEIDSIFKKIVRKYTDGKACNMTKTEFKTAVTEAEAWVTTNETSFNNALSNPFKANATTQEKALLLAYVLSVKYLGG